MAASATHIGWLLLAPVVYLGRALRSLLGLVGAVLGSFRFWLLLILSAIVTLVAYYVVADRYTPLTVDAYVQAFVVQVAPQVGGQVVRVYVREGDPVEKGMLLFELDARPFEHKVALLEAKHVEAVQQVKQLGAQVEAARAEHRRLTAEAAYAKSVYEQEVVIYKKASTTERKYLDALQKHKASVAALDRSAQLVQQADDALEARIGAEHTLVAQARAQLAEARLNLEYCKVYAPCDGIITNLQLRDGAYAHVGQAVLACIDTSHWLVIGNYREECLEYMKAGQPALVAFQGVPGRLWPGRVEHIGWGVGQGQGVPSGQLPHIKDQTSWIPASQRFQVRVALDENASVPLRVGMTGSITVYVEPDARLNRVTETVHRLIAWFYYL